MVIITLLEMMAILLMAKQKIKLTRTKTTKYRKSKITKDKNGNLHCKTCGAFISGRGKKKK